MSGRGAESRLLRTIGAVRVFAMLEVEANFIKTFFAYEIFPVGAEVPAINDGVDESIRVRLQITAALDAADTFEA